MISLVKLIASFVLGFIIAIILSIAFLNNPKDKEDVIVDDADVVVEHVYDSKEESNLVYLGELDQAGGVIEDENFRVKALEGILSDKVSFSYLPFENNSFIATFDLRVSNLSLIEGPLIITMKYGDQFTQEQKTSLVPLIKHDNRYEETKVIGRDYEENSITFEGGGTYHFVLLENHDKE